MSNQGWRVDGSNPVLTITSAADLATGNTLQSSTFDNTPGTLGAGVSYTWADLELNCPNGLSATVGSGEPVEIYVLPTIASTPTFTSNFTDAQAPQNAFRGAFIIPALASAGTAFVVGLTRVPIPPYVFSVGIRNNTGVSLKDGASHFTVKVNLVGLANV